MADTAKIEIPADDTDVFYSESNMRYLNKVIDGIENGTRPLTEHDLIEDNDTPNQQLAY